MKKMSAEKMDLIACQNQAEVLREALKRIARYEYTLPKRIRDLAKNTLKELELQNHEK